MSRKDRVMIFLSSFFWAVLGMFFFGSFYFFLIPVLAFSFIFVGVKKNV